MEPAGEALQKHDTFRDVNTDVERQIGRNIPPDHTRGKLAGGVVENEAILCHLSVYQPTGKDCYKQSKEK